MGEGQKKSAFEQALTVQSGKPLAVPGRPHDRHRPLFRGDLVAALSAAVAGDQVGDYDLVGFIEVTTEEIVQLVNPGKTAHMRYISPFLFRAFHNSSKWALPDLLVPIAAGSGSDVQDLGVGHSGLLTLLNTLRAGHQ